MRHLHPLHEEGQEAVESNLEESLFESAVELSSEDSLLQSQWDNHKTEEWNRYLRNSMLLFVFPGGFRTSTGPGRALHHPDGARPPDPHATQPGHAFGLSGG